MFISPYLKLALLERFACWPECPECTGTGHTSSAVAAGSPAIRSIAPHTPRTTLVLSSFKVVASIIEATFSIMVPTGKVGPITPRKIVPEPIVTPTSFRNPAPVWERIDEGPNPYQPPVYRYTLYEFARKYGRRTLISPPDDEYYKPGRSRPRPSYVYKTKFYYSPLQFL